jgi:hypothetical protein
MGLLKLLEPKDQVRSTAVPPDEFVEIPNGLVKVGLVAAPFIEAQA